MKILITGSTGFIGSHLIEKIHDTGYQITLLVRNQEKIDNQYQIINADILDYNKYLTFIPEFDLIVHLAAILDSSNPLIESVNYKATQLIIENMRADSKIVFLSSATVKYPIKSLYAKSKLDAEKIIENSGKSYVIIRPSWIIGKNSPSFCKLIHMINKFPVIPIVNTTIQPTLVEDLITFIILSFENYNNETIEVAGSKISYKEFISALMSKLGVNKPIITIPYFIFTILYYVQKCLHKKIITKDALLDMKYTVDIDPEIIGKKYRCTLTSIHSISKEDLVCED